MELLTALGLTVPAGLNAYIPLLAVALGQRFGWIELREPFGLLGEWWVIALVAALLVVEILADKFPAVDHVNDAVNTVVRPAAGGLLAVAASGQAGEAHPVVMVVAGVIVAGGVHAAKATTRPVANASTGGCAAPVLSVAEDVLALIGTVLAIVAPVLALAVVATIAMLFWRLWRLKRRTSAAV